MSRRTAIVTAVLALVFCFASAAAAGDVLTKAERAWLKGHGPLTVAVHSSYPAYAYADKSGRPMGMAVDYWRLMARRLKLRVEFIPIHFKDLMAGIRSGKYDTATGIFDMAYRRKWFDFTRPFYTIRNYVYVHKKHAGRKGIRDLKGLRVGAVHADSGSVNARAAGLRPILYRDYVTPVLDLARGKLAAVVMGRTVVEYVMAKYKLGGLIRRVGGPTMIGRLCLPVKKGNRVLLGILKKGVALVTKADWRKIERRWLGAAR